MLGHRSRLAVEMLLLLLVVLLATLLSPTGAAAQDAASVPRVRQEQALDKLQQVFRLGNVPQRSGHQVPPQFMTELYKTIADPSGVTRGRNPYNARVVRSFIERDNSQSQFFYFNISGLEAGERVLEAELHLFRRRGGPPSTAPNYLIRVFQVLNESRLDNPDYHRLLSVRPVSAHASGWEVFNVKAAVMDWMNGRSVNKGLLVTTTDIFGEPVEIRFARRDAHHNSKQPILVLFDDDGTVHSETEETIPHSLLNYPNYYTYQSDDTGSQDVETSTETRDRRSAPAHKDASSNSSECTRKHLYVDFGQIGWISWIIAPKGYDAYYCQGSCDFPLGQNLKPTNHATVQSIVHELQLQKNVGRPCCVPNSLLSVPVLFFDDNENVVLKRYADMVAESCGCH